MGNNDRRLVIPAVFISKIKIPSVGISRVKERLPIKISGKIEGRPVVVLKRLIDLGVEKGYYDQTLIGKLIEFGFDRDYWNDAAVFAEPFKYFMLDKTKRKSKEERLKKLETEYKKLEEDNDGAGQGRNSATD